MEKTPSHAIREVASKLVKIANAFEKFESDMVEALGHAEKSIDGARSIDMLTDKQKEIFFLLAEGLERTDIAAKLKTSPKTISSHLKAITHRLKFDSLQELKKFAIKQKPH